LNKPVYRSVNKR